MDRLLSTRRFETSQLFFGLSPIPILLHYLFFKHPLSETFRPSPYVRIRIRVRWWTAAACWAPTRRWRRVSRKRQVAIRLASSGELLLRHFETIANPQPTLSLSLKPPHPHSLSTSRACWCWGCWMVLANASDLHDPALPSALKCEAQSNPKEFISPCSCRRLRPRTRSSERSSRSWRRASAISNSYLFLSFCWSRYFIFIFSLFTCGFLPFMKSETCCDVHSQGAVQAIRSIEAGGMRSHFRRVMPVFPSQCRFQGAQSQKEIEGGDWASLGKLGMKAMSALPLDRAIDLGPF